MLKKIIFSVAILLTLTAFVLPVFAQDFGLTDTAGKLGYNTSEENPIYARVQAVVNVVLSMVSIVFFILMTYAGLRWMTSRGNEELAAKAKHALEAAVIGIIITVSAYALSNFVLSRLGAGSAGGGGTTAGGAVCKVDKDCAGNNIVCEKGQCMTICQRNYGKKGFCEAADSPLCDGLQKDPNLCEGGQVCCH